MRRPPWWVSGIAGAALFLLHLPVVVLMAFSFNASRFSMEWSGFTLDWYARLLERGDILEALRASLVVALASTALATAFGTLIALALARHVFPGRRVYQGLLSLPIVACAALLVMVRVGKCSVQEAADGLATVISAIRGPRAKR